MPVAYRHSNPVAVGRFVTSCLAALACLVVAVYLPGIHGRFAFDDFPNIVFNEALRTGGAWTDWLDAALASPARDLPRPLSMLSLAIDLRLGGGDAVVFKLTNIAIHVANTLLAYLLARELFARAGTPGRDPRSAALLAAALWALHPVNATPVLYVVQRMESLAQLFVFGGLVCYCRSRNRQLESGCGWASLYAVLVTFTALGILAKESAALLPLYSLCLEFFLFGFAGAERGTRRRMAWMYVLVLAVPAALGVAWLLPKALAPGAFAGREFTLQERLLTEPRVLFEYLRWILLPDLSRLGFFHDGFRLSKGWLAPPTTVVAIFGLVALALASCLGRKRWPLPALGVAWFLCAHALTASFVPLELVFEHRNYFASFGICLAVAGGVEHAMRTREGWRWTLLAGTGVVLLLAQMSHLRAREWADPLVFARSEASRFPLSPRATYNYGWVLANAARVHPDPELVSASFAALERARRVPGAGVLPDQALLTLAARTGRSQHDEWWDELVARLRAGPIGPQERGALAGLTDCAIARLCDFPDARMRAVFAAALSHGENAGVLNPYGNYVLNVRHDVDLAFRAWSRCKQLVPQDPQYRISLAKLLIATGHYDQAEAEIRGLEGLGRLHQYRREAARLRTRMAAARRSQS
jgi:hypothetical protein